jgi:hypothetical protein
MNVTPPHWACVFPKARSPLTPALARTFNLPRDDPPQFRTLLRQLEPTEVRR